MWLVTKSVASEMKRIMCSKEKPTLDSMTFQELNIRGKAFKVLFVFVLSIYKKLCSSL